MSIDPRDILGFYGGAALARYGTLTRKVGPISRGGEEAKEVWTRAGGGALQRTRAGLYVAAGANIPRIERLDLDGDGIFETPSMLVESARTNVVENSDVENDLVGYNTQVATAVRDNTVAINGSWAVKVTTTNAAFSDLIFQTRAGVRFTAAAGTVYTLSAWVYAPAASVGKTLILSFDWYTAGAAFISNSSSAPVALVAGWQRLVFTATAPATTASMDTRLRTNTIEGVFSYWVDLPQLEVLPFASNPIATLTAAVTQNSDVASCPYYAPPQAMAIYIKLIARGTYLTTSARVLQISAAADSNPRLFLIGSGTIYSAQWVDGSGTGRVANASGAPTANQPVELIVTLSANGVLQLLQSVNGAALTSGAPDSPLALPAAWSGPLLWLGQINGGSVGFDPLIAIIVVRAPNNVFPSLADFQALLPTFSATT